MTNLADRTPADIDAEINELQYQQAIAERRTADYSNLAAKYVESGQTYSAERYQAELAKWADKLEEVSLALAPLYAEFNRRGGWTRFYLVTNSNGHVHHTTSCTTCFPSTQFGWLTQFSGTSHADLVELAGEKACTVCFPDAPVDVLHRASRLSTPEQEARKAEKEKRAAEKAANEVVVPEYRDYSRTITKTFKTVRAVTNQIASDLSTLTWYGPTNFQAEVHNIAQMIAALAAKGVEYDYDKALANARKKTVREGGVAKY